LKKVDAIIVKLDSILLVLAELDGKFSNEIPKLFIMYPENLKDCWTEPLSWINTINVGNKAKSFWKQTKSLVTRKVANIYYFQFVCAHSFKAIGPPLKIKIAKEWVEKIAPVLALSLSLLNLAVQGTINVKIGQSHFERHVT
jgi:hypothetical protein